MKRTTAVVLAALILCFPPAGANENITIYSLDGRTAVIDGKALEDYKKVGWYETFEETVRTLYSFDGRRINVYAAQVPEYTAVGWYENYEDTVSSLYSPNGETIKVYKSEVPTYVALGWFENRADTLETIFNDNGEFVEVYRGQVDTYIALGWYLLPTRIDPKKPMLALTFDDGPSALYTSRILNTLEKYRSKATFFLVGMMVSSNPESVRRELAMGCELGTHTYNHPNLSTLSANQVSAELTASANAVLSASGAYPTVFRPPYGTYNATVSNCSNLPLISWSVDPEDWRTRNPMSTFNHIISHAQDGDIILMHDVYDATAQAVDMLVPALIKKGFQLVTVSELAAYRSDGMRAGKMYYKFR